MNFKKKYFFFCYFAVFSMAAFCQYTVSAGPKHEICKGQSVQIGGNPTAQGSGPFTYTWQPAGSLNDASLANPNAFPASTTVYTVFVSNGSGDRKSATTTVTVHSYTLSAGHDTTIKQGQTITLHGSAAGDSAVYWSGNVSVLNPATLTPDLYAQYPGTDSLVLVVFFPHGCTYYDNIVIHVIADEQLYFFNSFTPNGDGVNDVFVIGNIDKYPDNTFEVYNRYGQKVFHVAGYQNDWSGSYLGNDLPSGTYFYILDPHDSSGKVGKYKGQINIVR